MLPCATVQRTSRAESDSDGLGYQRTMARPSIQIGSIEHLLPLASAAVRTVNHELLASSGSLKELSRGCAQVCNLYGQSDESRSSTSISQSMGYLDPSRSIRLCTQTIVTSAGLASAIDCELVCVRTCVSLASSHWQVRRPGSSVCPLQLHTCVDGVILSVLSASQRSRLYARERPGAGGTDSALPASVTRSNVITGFSGSGQIGEARSEELVRTIQCASYCVFRMSSRTLTNVYVVFEVSKKRLSRMTSTTSVASCDLVTFQVGFAYSFSVDQLVLTVISYSHFRLVYIQVMHLQS